MSHKQLTIGLVITGLCLMIGTASAKPAGHGAGGLSDLDKNYLKDTAQSNIEEIQFAPTVQKKAVRPEARAYGRQMRRDHTNAQRELEALARQKHVSLPQKPSEDEHDIMDRLAREPRATFDAAYKQEMIRDHTTDIAETRREISLGRDPQVKASAQKNLVLLQMHLKMAHSLPST